MPGDGGKLYFQMVRGVQSVKRGIVRLCGKSQAMGALPVSAAARRRLSYPSAAAKRSVAAMSEERISGSAKECPDVGQMHSSACGQARCRAQAVPMGQHMS